MSTSFDDQASQSTTTDQQSETSSANPQSPRSSSAVYSVTGNGNNNQMTTQNSLLMQQNYLAQESYMYPHSSSGYSQINDVRNLHHHQQRAAAQAGINPTFRGLYTGVDKLIIAAMLEDSAAKAAASGAASYMPSGRGIGYPSRDSYTHQIPAPSNKSELELYYLLERANLLNYFGTFLNFGGDDVQQLSDADEDEFLEIMSLVGMTQKPLHVRRLQKALIEWRESKEVEINNLRRPAAQIANLGTTNNNIVTNHSRIVESVNHNQQQAQTLHIPTTTSDMNNHAKRQQQNYTSVPHEILVGAPKRLRLMDNLHKRETINTGNQQQCKPTEPSKPIQSNTDTTTTTLNIPPNATDDNSIEQLPLSPSSQKSTDRDDDKLIEVMNSPQSVEDLETDDTRLACDESANSTRYSNNKYGRYKASLRDSPSKMKP